MRKEVLLPKGYEMTITPQPWIPVTELLPEDGVPVAIVADRGRTPDNRGVVAAGELYRGCWYHTLPGLVSRRIADVTHWMPLPAPPMDDK